jgi:hypothetical protein
MPVDAEREAQPLGAGVGARPADGCFHVGHDLRQWTVGNPERLFACGVGGVAASAHLVGVPAETRRARAPHRGVAAPLELLG